MLEYASLTELMRLGMQGEAPGVIPKLLLAILTITLKKTINQRFLGHYNWPITYKASNAMAVLKNLEIIKKSNS